MSAKRYSPRLVKDDEHLHLPRIYYSSSDSTAEQIIHTPPLSKPPLIKANSFSNSIPHTPNYQSPTHPNNINHRRKLKRSSLSDEVPDNINLTPVPFRTRSSSQNAHQNVNCNNTMVQLNSCLERITSKLGIDNFKKNTSIHEIIQSISQVNIIISDNPRFLLMSNITNKCFDIISTLFVIINFETTKTIQLKSTLSLYTDINDVNLIDENEVTLSPIFNDLWMNIKLMLLKIFNNSAFYNQLSLCENRSIKTLINTFTTNGNTKEANQIKDVLEAMYKRISGLRKLLFTVLLDKIIELLYEYKNCLNEIEKIDGVNRLLSLFEVYTFQTDEIIYKETLTKLFRRYILPFLILANFGSFCDNYGSVLNSYLNYDYHYSIMLLKYMKSHWPNQDGNKTSLFLIMIQNTVFYLDSIKQFTKVYFILCVDIFIISIKYHPVVTIDTFYEICKMDCVSVNRGILDKYMCKRMLDTLDVQENYVVSSCVNYTLLKLTLLRKK